MRPDPKLWIPLALVTVPAPVLATQYLTLAQAQKGLFPDADAFVAKPIETHQAWIAKRGSTSLGYVFLDNVVGKHELITYALGVGADGAVRGVEILDYRETRGGEVRDPRWRAQFVGKTSASPLRLEEDIQNVSGATLSCRHITEGVRRLLALYQRVLSPR